MQINLTGSKIEREYMATGEAGRDQTTHDHNENLRLYPKGRSHLVFK